MSMKNFAICLLVKISGGFNLSKIYTIEADDFTEAIQYAVNEFFSLNDEKTCSVINSTWTEI
jgi:hypothetical protein